jgi:hypothetical protein
MGITSFSQQSISREFINPVGSGNLIINGDFEVWQRGTSFSAGGYTADRWFSHANDNVSRQNFTLTNPEIPSSKHFLRLSPNSIGGFHTIQYNIENAGESLSGKAVTISFWARSNTSNSYDLTMYTALLNDQQLVFPNSLFSLTPTWTKYTGTFNIPITNNSNIHRYLRWHTGVSDNSRGFDLAQVQLEEGTVATPFRRNANSIQGELAACQRYCQVLGVSGVGMWFSTTTCQITWPLLVEMRVSPSVTLTTTTPSVSDAGVANRVGSGSTFSIDTSSTTGIKGNINGFSSATNGRVAQVQQAGIIRVEAEL